MSRAPVIGAGSTPTDREVEVAGVPSPGVSGVPRLPSGPGPHTIIVLAKSPVSGRVKTRLSPTFTPAEAAALAAAAIRDTFDTVVRVGPVRMVVAWDGPVVPWIPAAARVVRQRGGGLDERLEHVFADVLGPSGDASGGLTDVIPDRPTLLVGMDTPQVTAADLAHAARQLLAPGVDAVLGPAVDGGFWAIGLRRWQPGLVAGVAMSRAGTGAEQLSRLRTAGLRVDLLPVQHDVDTADDVVLVARAAPGSRFAATVHRHGGRGDT